VTINPGAAVMMGSGGTMRIGGTMTITEHGVAAQLANTFVEYNGGDQTILNPNGATPGYDNLILSALGPKTMPVTALSIRGNFSMSGTASASAGSAINQPGQFYCRIRRCIYDRSFYSYHWRGLLKQRHIYNHGKHHYA